MANNKVEQLLADSRLAFLNQQNDTALRLAKEAIKLEPRNADAYKCAANAYMSMERYEEAIQSYRDAVKHDERNGNRYYDLGFAYATNNKTTNAVRAFSKAEELGCAPENLVQLYHILGIICFDMGRYDDALINLSKAEQLLGVDLDVLQRKAVIYGMKNDIRRGLETANQMKLVSPSEYIGYQVAFKLLVQAKRLDSAERELRMAAKYTKPSMNLCFDRITLELERYNQDKNKAHFHKALGEIETALKTVKAAPADLIDSYINAAELYLQLEDADRTIACLNAAQNPIESFENGFEIVPKEHPTETLTDYDVEDMIVEDRERIAEEYGDYGLEELAETVEPDEDGAREYFTEIPEDLEEPAEPTVEEREFHLTPENVDQINRLFVGAYTLKKDFEQVSDYSRKLQASENVVQTYIGKYTEANAMLQLQRPDAREKYQELLRFFRNAMIKDPTDLAAVSYRIQCYIDLGEYAEAEQMTRLLSPEVRANLEKKIAEAKAKEHAE